MNTQHQNQESLMDLIQEAVIRKGKSRDIDVGWALVGGLALVFVCMLIGGREGMLLFGVVVVMSAVLGLVAWITK